MARVFIQPVIPQATTAMAAQDAVFEHGGFEKSSNQMLFQSTPGYLIA